MQPVTAELLRGVDEMSYEEIKNFFAAEDIHNLPAPVKDYISRGRFNKGARINTVEQILIKRICEEFIKGNLVPKNKEE